MESTSRVHLSPRIYTALQEFVHRGHHATFARLVRMLELPPGGTVVELGCGAGTLAHHFVEHGYCYCGIDIAPERIARARQRTPQAQFLVGDAVQLDRTALPGTKFYFIHGVLHHLDDAACRRVIDSVLSDDPDAILAITEPFRPEKWWKNPLGSLLASLDEGAFVRTLEGWKTLFAANLESYSTRHLWPRWPVNLMDARLLPSAKLSPIDSTEQSNE